MYRIKYKNYENIYLHLKFFKAIIASVFKFAVMTIQLFLSNVIFSLLTLSFSFDVVHSLLIHLT